MGDLPLQREFQKTDSRREIDPLRPLFFREDLLIGGDTGRFRRVGARSMQNRKVRFEGRLRTFIGCFQAPSPRFRIRGDIGRFSRGHCLGGVDCPGELGWPGGSWTGWIGIVGGANMRAMSIAVLLSLTRVKSPGSTRR